jgi:cytochrome P450 family 135
MHRRYGDVFAMSLPSFAPVVFVASPELVKQVFTGDTSLFHAGEGNAEVVEPVLGPHSVLVLDEDEHIHARKVLLPPFHGERMLAYTELIRDVADRDIATWPLGKPFKLLPHTQAITLEVILRAIFGLTDQRRIDHGRDLMADFSHRSNAIGMYPFLRRDLGPFSPWRRFVRARDALHEFVREEIDARKAESSIEERDDVLSMLLQATHEDGSPMSYEELRDELVTMIGAGHDTTSTALAWALDCLLHNPRALERLRESISAGEDDYLDATIKETLRMHPVLSEVARKLTRSTELGGYSVPAGTVVMPSITALHYREDLYPDPTEFRPERFLDAKTEQYSWIPYGGGTRRCVGAAFAHHEMRIVLPRILERTELRAARPRPDRVGLMGVTKPPARGARVVLERPPLPVEQAEPLVAKSDSG